MAIKFMEGFELNAADTSTNHQYYDRKFASFSGVPADVGGIISGLAMLSSSVEFTTEPLTAGDVWILHWWWRFDTVAESNQNARVELQNSSGEQLSIEVSATGGGATDQKDRFNVHVRRGATTLATAGPFWANEWHSFQLKATIDPVNGAYNLKVDDVSVVSDVGPVNTANQAVANADRFLFSLDNGLRNMYLDHVVIMDDSGTANNDFPGELIVRELLPNAEGDNLDWTPSSGSTHYLLVNEAMPNNAVVSVEDPKRVSSETVSDLDRWHFTNLASLGLPSTTTVLGVSVETCAAMEASGNRDVRAIFKDTGGSTAEGASFNVSGTSFDVYVQIWETNPATAAAWTVASVDAGQFGVKLQA